MQVSSVNYKDLNPEFRIDAEYYRSEVLTRLNVLDKHKNEHLVNLVDFIVGPFGSTVTADKYVAESSFRYIRNKDIKDFKISNNEPVFIPQSLWEALPQFHIHENDLLITVVGTLGKVALATKKDVNSIFSCKSTVLRSKAINPYYLLTYLNSDTGKLFSLRGKRGVIQEGLNLSDLKEIKVFVPSDSFQLAIEKNIRLAFALKKEADVSYKESEHVLLHELGLHNWQPKHIKSYIKYCSDTMQAERMDAEYFQPKYGDIINTIKKYRGGCEPLSKLVTIKDELYTPKKGQKYKYIELANITGNGEIEGYMYEDGSELPSRARRKVAVGDLIVSSIEGSLSCIATIDQEHDNALCSTGFHVIRSTYINSETILVYLKSIMGQLLLKKGCSGTILTAISKDELDNVMLPKFTKNTQLTIQIKVAESFKLRKQSKHLLECAKKTVEMAIEHDEKTAIAWLNEQVKQVGAQDAN